MIKLKYGYARVSSRGQAYDGNSLEAQEALLKQSGAEKIISECYTGMKIDRPKFSKLIEQLKQGDELIVCKLDRFARTSSEGAKLVSELVKKGVRVNILNMGVADNTPMGKLMITIMFAFAEFERDMIVERTSAGKEVARKQAGWREGRPSKKPKNFEKIKKAVDDGEISIKDALKELGICRQSWYNYCSAGEGA